MAFSKKKQKTSARQRQLLEVVDADNRVVGLMPWGQIHEQNLMHRSVFVCLYNQQKKLFIQKRSLVRTVNPGCWDLSANGHVRAAESPKEAAIRKLREGLGISVSSVRLHTILPAGPQTGYEFVFLFYAGISAQVPQPDHRKILQGLFVEEHELAYMVRSFAEYLTAGLLYFWKQGLLFQKECPDE
jgi:isopentenyldiphosphate isomerase